MKKLTNIALAASALFMLAIPATSQASSLYKGEKTLGITGGFATHNHSGYAGAYFQYTFVPHVRIAPEIDYVFRRHDSSAVKIDCDVQFPFRLARGFNIYPLAGLAFNAWSNTGARNECRVGGNVGAGFDLYMTSNLKVSIQGKYSFLKDVDGAFVGLGVGYVF